MKLNYPILITETEQGSEGEFVYVQSQGKNELLKLNASLKAKKSFSRVVSIFKDIFLPRGYPDSVSKDYVNYQIWDTLQACCSTITGTLATKAVLQGIGVGDSTANSTSAAVTWVLKDGIGLLAKIAFAWGIGSGLDGECKKWRMFADILNDTAIFTELIFMTLYTEYAFYILCFSTSLKGLVGVAGGATRAAITQHQAVKENMADVSAKDGSQETCVNLLTSLMGVGLLSYFGDNSALWYLFVILTYFHLYCNYKAVKALNFNFFNNERLVIFLKNYFLSDIALPPQEVNERESVLLGAGESDSSICGHKIKIGCSLDKITSKKLLLPLQIQFLAHLYKKRKYMIVLCENQNTIYVFLDTTITSKDVLEAYFHAVILGIGVSYIKNSTFLPTKKFVKGDKFKQFPSQSKMLNSLYESLSSKQIQYLMDKQGIDISVLMTIDNFATQHATDCFQNAAMMGWDIEKNLLKVDNWRA